MGDGKKHVAEKIVYGALRGQQQRGPAKDPLRMFRGRVDNTKPMVEVKSRRVGGSTYQVPVEVRPERQQALALRWLIEHARKRAGKRWKSANELITRPATVAGPSRREDMHRMAEANKAFATTVVAAASAPRERTERITENTTMAKAKFERNKPH